MIDWERVLGRFIAKMSSYDGKHNTYLSYYLNGMTIAQGEEMTKLLEQSYEEIQAEGSSSSSSPATITKEQLDAVYAERNMCVALIYHMARCLDYDYGLRQSSDFEPGWQNCVMIDLPTGQVSWHIKDSEQDWFAEGNMLRGYTREWDGHTFEEKYQRVLAFPGIWEELQRVNEKRQHQGEEKQA